MLSWIRTITAIKILNLKFSEYRSGIREITAQTCVIGSNPIGDIISVAQFGRATY